MRDLMTLEQFNLKFATSAALKPGQCEQIVEQALMLMERFYVHLPLKRTMHAVDPIQCLRLLQFRLNKPDAPRQFHHEMLSIFIRLRDLHTAYMLPRPYQEYEAFLPFRIQEYYDAQQKRCYTVSRIVDDEEIKGNARYFPPDADLRKFRMGVDVTHWNGTPIDLAVERNADREAGSNQEARHARGLEAMTNRPLAYTIPPDEEWVMVRYKYEVDVDDGGRQFKHDELRFDWLVGMLERSATDAGPRAARRPTAATDAPTAATDDSIDAKLEAIRKVQEELYGSVSQAASRLVEDVQETSAQAPREVQQILAQLAEKGRWLLAKGGRRTLTQLVHEGWRLSIKQGLIQPGEMASSGPAVGGPPTDEDGDRARDARVNCLGIDRKAEMNRRTKRAVLMHHQALADEKTLTDALSGESDVEVNVATTSLLPDNFEFRKVSRKGGSPMSLELDDPLPVQEAFGYIRIKSFQVPALDQDPDPHAFVEEFSRIVALKAFPPDGLILDVRGNPGGNILAGELLLQLLTPGPIEPARFHFLNSPMTRALCRHPSEEFFVWQESIEQAIETGETFSQGFPLRPPYRYNLLGQKYQGPVVLIVDALCYSTTDIFAAGFEDHGIGTIIGTSSRTGAGGANVWRLEDLRNLFRELPPRGMDSGAPSASEEGEPEAEPEEPPLPKDTEILSIPLPEGASFRVAMRRSTRVRNRSGNLLEDLGVVVEKENIYPMTKKDVLEHNEGLLAFAVQKLEEAHQEGHVYSLVVDHRSSPADRPVRVAVITKNLDRVDIYEIVDLNLRQKDRPWKTHNVKNKDGTDEIDLPELLTAGTLELRGFSDGSWVVTTRWDL